MLKLDIGCGGSKRAGFVGVDRLCLPGTDVRHDLDVFPYPFGDSAADEIWMDNVLEHLQDPVRVMEEIHRIAKPNALVTVSVPFFRSLYACVDPTHRHMFSAQWFSYFDPSHPFCAKYAYSPVRFRVERVQYDRELRAAGKLGWFRAIIVGIAERHPWWYEQKLSHWYPLDSLTFHLKVIKDTP